MCWPAVLRWCTDSVAHGRLQGSVLFRLAADVVEGEEQVVVVRQVGGNLHLHFLVELWRPEGGRRTHTTCLEKTL